MRDELRALRTKNARLCEKVRDLEESTEAPAQLKPGKRGGPTIASLQSDLRRTQKVLAKQQAVRHLHFTCFVYSHVTQVTEKYKNRINKVRT